MQKFNISSDDIKENESKILNPPTEQAKKSKMYVLFVSEKICWIFVYFLFEIDKLDDSNALF